MVVLHLWYLYSLCGGFGSTNLPTPSMFFLRLVSICIFKQSSAILNFGELIDYILIRVHGVEDSNFGSKM